MRLRCARNRRRRPARDPARETALKAAVENRGQRRQRSYGVRGSRGWAAAIRIVGRHREGVRRPVGKATDNRAGWRWRARHGGRWLSGQADVRRHDVRGGWSAGGGRGPRHGSGGIAGGGAYASDLSGRGGGREDRVGPVVLGLIALDLAVRLGIGPVAVRVRSGRDGRSEAPWRGDGRVNGRPGGVRWRVIATMPAGAGVWGQADARGCRADGRQWRRAGGAVVSRSRLGALAGARTRRQAVRPTASLCRDAASAAGRGG